MTQLLPISGWNGLHPLIVHIPIALLLIAPLFVIVGALLPSGRGRAFLMTAFIFIVLGSAAVFFAVETGEAAAKLATQTPEIKAVLAEHQKFAQTIQVLFSALTLAFAAMLFVPRFLRRELDRRLHSQMLAAYLIFYLAGVLLLLNTAQQGERLVHEFKVTAPVATVGHAE